MSKITAFGFLLLLAGCGVQTPRKTPFVKTFPLPKYENSPGARAYRWAPVDKGFVVTKNRDTIAGLVKLIFFPYGDHIPVLPTGKQAAEAIINVRRKNIELIRTFQDSTNRTPTDYANIDFDGLWRVLARKDSTGLFDNYDGMGNGQKYSEKRMILVSKGEKVLMYSGWHSLFQSRNGYLLRFMNKRYHQHYKKDEFKDLQAEMDYIVNKENEKY